MNRPVDTKAKILYVARELFADQGFDGTSVRDIAKSADVNVAAVNYHFENKQNLFWNVFKQSVENLEEAILSLDPKNSMSVPDLAAKIYRMMQERKNEMRATFRMILSTHLPETEDFEGADFCQGRVGPPGSEAIERAILKEVGDDADPQAIFWGSKVIFSHIVHAALMISTDYVQRVVTEESRPMIEDEYVIGSIKQLAKAVVSYLKDNQDGIKRELFGS